MKYYKKNKQYSEFLEKQNPNSFIKYVDFVKKYLRRDGVFLDVGCGTGIALEQLRKKKINAMGVEVSETSIKKCKDKKLITFLHNGVKIPFDNQYFDMVGSFNVLEHTDSPLVFLEEQYRVLKIGGYLIISCPNFLSVTNSYHWHTSGLLNKAKNFIQIINKALSADVNFKKMKTMVKKEFHVDDDACNITNPIDVIKWSRNKKMRLIYWSSQEQYTSGLKDILDKGFLRNFFGAVFMVYQKT